MTTYRRVEDHQLPVAFPDIFIRVQSHSSNPSSSSGLSGLSSCPECPESVDNSVSRYAITETAAGVQTETVSARVSGRGLVGLWGRDLGTSRRRAIGEQACKGILPWMEEGGVKGKEGRGE